MSVFTEETGRLPNGVFYHTKPRSNVAIHRKDVQSAIANVIKRNLRVTTPQDAEDNKQLQALACNRY